MSKFREQLVLEMFKDELVTYRVPRDQSWGSEGQTTSEFGVNMAMRAQHIAAACCKMWGHAPSGEDVPVEGGPPQVFHRGRQVSRPALFQAKRCGRCGKDIPAGTPHPSVDMVDEDDE
ncbi:MAG: hypothetical protein ACYDH4_09540 [Candidatus Cryosericum sp.]